MYERALAQERKSKNKVYSFHEPDVDRMIKGKEHKYSAKAYIVTTKNSGIIVGASASQQTSTTDIPWTGYSNRWSIFAEKDQRFEFVTEDTEAEARWAIPKL
jgi:hypothetical protein